MLNRVSEGRRRGRKGERDRELGRLVEALREMGAEKVILFGSCARGEEADYSDLDILAVMESDLPFVERMGEVYRRLRPCEADVFVYTPKEMEEGNRVIRESRGSTQGAPLQCCGHPSCRGGTCVRPLAIAARVDFHAGRGF